MKRRALFTSALLAGALTLAGCSSNEPDEPKPTSESAVPAEAPTESPTDKESSEPAVDKELRKQIDTIVGQAVSSKSESIENASRVMKAADQYLEEHEGSPADGTDNPFTTLENFSDETNNDLFGIYSEDSPMLEYFSLDGLEPNEKAAIALWSQSMPLIFTQGEVTVGSDAFVHDGNKATVDLSKAKVTTQAGQGSLIEANQELGELPMIKKDGEWLIDSKSYYSKLESIAS